MRWFLGLLLLLIGLAIGFAAGMRQGFVVIWPASPDVGKEQSPAPDEATLLRHPFWKKQVSRAELDAVLERLTHPGAHSRLAVLSDATVDRAYDNGMEWMPLDVPDPGRFVILSPRADRPEMISALKGAMDQEVADRDYRQRYPRPRSAEREAAAAAGARERAAALAAREEGLRERQRGAAPPPPPARDVPLPGAVPVPGGFTPPGKD